MSVLLTVCDDYSGDIDQASLNTPSLTKDVKMEGVEESQSPLRAAQEASHGHRPTSAALSQIPLILSPQPALLSKSLRVSLSLALCVCVYNSALLFSSASSVLDNCAWPSTSSGISLHFLPQQNMTGTSNAANANSTHSSGPSQVPVQPFVSDIEKKQASKSQKLAIMDRANQNSASTAAGAQQYLKSSRSIQFSDPPVSQRKSPYYLLQTFRFEAYLLYDSRWAADSSYDLD